MTKITALTSIRMYYHETNLNILRAFAGLSESQVRWRPNSSCHSVAFIFWHLARWSDHLQTTIPGMTEELARRLPAGEQIWEIGQYATRWGFDGMQLGYSETGTDADLESFGEPPWPDKEVMADYARRAFFAAEQAIEAIDDEQFAEIELQQHTDEYMEESRARSETVGNAIMEHLVHNVHHLGELYYLRGLIEHAEGRS